MNPDQLLNLAVVGCALATVWVLIQDDVKLLARQALHIRRLKRALRRTRAP